MYTYYNILFLTDKKEIFYSFLKYLTSINSMDNPCLINDIDQLHQCDIKKVTLIICYTNFVNLAYKILNIHPSFVPIVLIIPEELIKIININSLARISIVVDSLSTLQTIWSTIINIQDNWKNPMLQARIKEITSSDILQFISTSRLTVIARIRGNYEDTVIKGCINFIEGKPQYAWSTNHEGNDAIQELISLNKGILDIIRNYNSLPIINVEGTIEEILIACAIKSDEPPERQ